MQGNNIEPKVKQVKAMMIEVNYKIDQILYLKNDEDQKQYFLNRIIWDGKDAILELFSPEGDLIEVKQCYVTRRKNVLKTLGDGKNET